MQTVFLRKKSYRKQSEMFNEPDVLASIWCASEAQVIL